MKIAIAPNSFKNSLDAFQVAKAIELGLKKSKLSTSCMLLPIADGGDHTLEVFHHWLGGTLRTTKVSGPLGKATDAQWLMIDKDKTAVIEMAKASGIHLVPEEDLNPAKASTFGTGELIVNALDEGAKRIILGIGGSATVDGGLGILQALGATLTDKKGNVLPTEGNALLQVAAMSLPHLHNNLAGTEFVVLCDVENPLMGENGAAMMFGPQKGASPAQVQQLEVAMGRYNELIKKKTGNDGSMMPGAGAAGGIGFSLKAFFNTRLLSGVEFLLSAMGFEEKVMQADLLITAEGKVDKQTLQGKGPMGVAVLAGKHKIPCIMLAGKVDDVERLNTEFHAVFPITNGPNTLDKLMQTTRDDLVQTSMQIGNLLALSGL
jgi:glycerate kinase